jgi:hypothetical protein
VRTKWAVGQHATTLLRRSDRGAASHAISDGCRAPSRIERWIRQLARLLMSKTVS